MTSLSAAPSSLAISLMSTSGNSVKSLRKRMTSRSLVLRQNCQYSNGDNMSAFNQMAPERDPPLRQPGVILCRDTWRAAAWQCSWQATTLHDATLHRQCRCVHQRSTTTQQDSTFSNLQLAMAWMSRHTCLRLGAASVLWRGSRLGRAASLVSKLKVPSCPHPNSRAACLVPGGNDTKVLLHTLDSCHVCEDDWWGKVFVEDWWHAECADWSSQKATTVSPT